MNARREDRIASAVMDRRVFLVGAAGSGGALLTRALGAQQPQPNFTPMEQDAYRPCIRPPKADPTPQLSDDQRDALEHRIKCQCGCILDVYTCRTTDFACQVSPAMHRDVVRLIAGGYTGEEILTAFVETYGEVAMTEPKREGFNWAGYLAPSVAMATGAVLLTVMLRKWAAESRAGAAARAAAGTSGSAAATGPNVSDDDLARLERAMREDA